MSWSHWAFWPAVWGAARFLLAAVATAAIVIGVVTLVIFAGWLLVYGAVFAYAEQRAWWRTRLAHKAGTSA